jgi:hypothetical protein
MSGEWKWHAELAIVVAVPVVMLGIAGWCVWRERKFEQRMSELDDMFDVWEQIKAEDAEPVDLDALWEMPAYRHAA